MKRVIGWIFLVLVSLAVGMGIGLGVSWGILPVGNKETTPVTLIQADKDIYRSFIADSYYATHDLVRAKIRLELLDGGGASDSIVDQMERLALDQGGGTDRNALLVLHDALVKMQDQSTPMSTFPINTGEATPSITTKVITLSSVSPFQTGKLTTSTSTPPAKPSIFIVRNRSRVCDSLQQPPLLQVIVFDQSGKLESGVVIIISSSAGSERILTGLKPELGVGYVDYQMNPGILYSLMIEGSIGNPEEVSAAECLSQGGGTYPGGWLLEIQH
ncbi:MAG: hypothetical protein WCF08_05060 [Anaerolineaceae bacterium]